MLLNNANLDIYPRSMVSAHDLEYGLARTPAGHKLVILGSTGNSYLNAFEGRQSEFKQHTLLIGPLNPQNAEALRLQIPWLQPVPLGLGTSAGMGDRLGIATPGHVRALREIRGRVAPIFAQQSIREMQRTGRSPQQVLDEATWGVFEEGWQGGVGAERRCSMIA